MIFFFVVFSVQFFHMFYFCWTFSFFIIAVVFVVIFDEWFYSVCWFVFWSILVMVLAIKSFYQLSLPIKFYQLSCKKIVLF